jgi:hypothetical protein
MTVFLCEASSDVREHTRNQPSRFEVCRSLVVGAIYKHRLCLTHAGLIILLGIFVVIGYLSYVI